MNQEPLWRRYVRFRGANVDADVREELQFHLEMQEREFLEGGYTAQDAKEAAHAAFGPREEVEGWLLRHDRQRQRRRERADLFTGIQQDVRFSLRTLAKQRTFTVTAVLVLALGIGATATVFSVLNALVLRPLPFDDADRLIILDEESDRSGGDTEFSYPRYLQYRDAETGLVGLGAQETSFFTLRGSAGSRPVTGAYVSSNFFDLLRIPPKLGRHFSSDEMRVGAAPVAIVSHDFWQSELGADPAPAGRQLTINAKSVTIVGIAPEGFYGLSPTDETELWLPITSYGVFAGDDYFLTPGGISWLAVFGRLRPGDTLAAAESRLSAVTRGLGREHPAHPEPKGMALERLGTLEPEQQEIVRRYLGILLGMALLVMLIASANVGGMLLTRATARRREMVVRLAVGAGRARLVRQLLTETMVIFALGGLTGLLIAGGLASAISISTVEGLPVPMPKGDWIDWRVVAFGVGLPLLAGIIFGLTPALHAVRGDLQPDLRTISRASDRRSITLRSVFTIGQIALTLVLLIAGGLFLRALRDGWRTELGFDSRRVATAQIMFPDGEYTDAEADAFYSELLNRLRESPAVEAAALAANMPLNSSRSSAAAGIPGTNRADRPMVRFNSVSPEYFRTMGIPLLAGREFLNVTSDEVILTRGAADMFFPGANPIGKELDVMGRRNLVVVGLAADATYDTLREEPMPLLYIPIGGGLWVSPHVRSAGAATEVIPILRRVIRELDPNVTVRSAEPLSQAVARQLLPQRAGSLLIGLFGLIGLLLAALGIYGVLAFDVAQRRQEIGVRIALGAKNWRVLRPILVRAAALLSVGALIGLAGGIAVARLLESVLLGVSPTDPLTLLVVVATLGCVGIGAAYLPARRATRVDPILALKSE